MRKKEMSERKDKVEKKGNECKIKNNQEKEGRLWRRRVKMDDSKKGSKQVSEEIELDTGNFK